MKKTLVALSCFLCAATLIGACSRSPREAVPEHHVKAANSRATAAMRSVDPAQAMTMIRERKDLIVVDVRTPQELVEGSIEGSIMVPFWSVMRGEHSLPRDKAILVVCAVGGRSYAAGQRLSGSGYPEVYNLSGGISAWKRAGLPVK